MPRRRKSFKRRKSRKGIRKGRRLSGRKRMGRPSTVIVRQPTGLPDKMFVKLRYLERYNQTHAAGIGAELYFRANSIYRPAGAGGSRQPYGSDQWENFYGYYTVYGSRIKVTLLQTQNTNLPMDVAVVPSRQTSIITADISSPVEEMPYSKYRQVSAYTNGMRQNVISSYMSSAKMFGVNPVAVKSEDNYGAAFGANPVDAWYWIVITQPSDEATAMTSTLLVQITYYVELLSRKNLAQS